MLDEWSSIPEDIQPYLADFIKRTLFPIQNVCVQIAAIEQRSRFRVGDGAETVGIELGSDASADINLDDFLVIENNQDTAVGFFAEMLFRHLQAVVTPGSIIANSAMDFVRVAFTQEPAFRELVRACDTRRRSV